MIPQSLTFRPFTNADTQACLGLFDQNCPAYFAPDERAEFEDYLRLQGIEYLVCDYENQIAAAFSFHVDTTQHTARINWIMIMPLLQNTGIGSKMIREAISRAKNYGKIRKLLISASQYSSAFLQSLARLLLVNTKMVGGRECIASKWN